MRKLKTCGMGDSSTWMHTGHRGRGWGSANSTLSRPQPVNALEGVTAVFLSDLHHNMFDRLSVK